jgi:hypothetical protein
MLEKWKVCVYTSELNFIGIPPCLILHESNQTTRVFKARAVLAVVRFAASWSWLVSKKLSVEGIIFLILALTAHVADASLVSKGLFTGRCKLAYCAAHFSLINFVLDIPSITLHQLWWQHAVIVCCNVIGGLILILGGTWMYDYERAWGCYTSLQTPSTHLDQLTSGYCMTWPGIITPPREICGADDQILNTKCSITTMPPWHTVATPVIHVALHLILVSIGVYVALIPAKLREIEKLFY